MFASILIWEGYQLGLFAPHGWILAIPTQRGLHLRNSLRHFNHLLRTTFSFRAIYIFVVVVDGLKTELTNKRWVQMYNDKQYYLILTKFTIIPKTFQINIYQKKTWWNSLKITHLPILFKMSTKLCKNKIICKKHNFLRWHCNLLFYIEMTTKFL